jgi:hypothetical protein
MHIIAGTVAIVSLIWLFPKWSESISQDWQGGISFTSGIAMVGYMLGCIFGLVINLLLTLFRGPSSR